MPAAVPKSVAVFLRLTHTFSEHTRGLIPKVNEADESFEADTVTVLASAQGRFNGKPFALAEVAANANRLRVHSLRKP